MDLTDAMVEAIAVKLAEKLKEQMIIRWGTAIEEMANMREISEKLIEQVAALEQQVQEQGNITRQTVQNAEDTITLMRSNQVKAKTALTYAMKELGLTE